mmetsp:Transcript_8350/g.22486  ORF Transcript_8350/g.22486 Transcript_8350/m.22486 type:complete len:337 (-) Transcript_8350:3404-4414(-)
MRHARGEIFLARRRVGVGFLQFLPQQRARRGHARQRERPARQAERRRRRRRLGGRMQVGERGRYFVRLGSRHCRQVEHGVLFPRMPSLLRFPVIELEKRTQHLGVHAFERNRGVARPRRARELLVGLGWAQGLLHQRLAERADDNIHGPLDGAGVDGTTVPARLLRAGEHRLHVPLQHFLGVHLGRPDALERQQIVREVRPVLLADGPPERLLENVPRHLANVLADRLGVRTLQQRLELLELDVLARLESLGDAPVALRHERLVGDREAGQVQQEDERDDSRGVVTFSNQVADQADRDQHDREREPHQRLDDVLQARRRVGLQLQHDRPVDDRDDK